MSTSGLSSSFIKSSLMAAGKMPKAWLNLKLQETAFKGETKPSFSAKDLLAETGGVSRPPSEKESSPMWYLL